MSPAISRLGFLDLPTSMEPRHSRIVARVRDTVTAYVGELREHATGLERDDGDLTERGRQNRRRAMFAEIAKHTTAAFAGARREIGGDADRASIALQGRLWNGVDGDRDRLREAKQELLALVGQHPVNQREIATDTTTGAAILASGGRVLSLLDSLVREGDLVDARLLTFAVLRGGPILKALVGGKPVTDAMTRIITERVVEADPEAAKHYAEREAAEQVVASLAGDEKHTLEAAARVLSLPKEIAHAPKADPIREQSERKPS